MATSHPISLISNEEAVSFDQLEPSKENIQPLLRSAGKRMHSLAHNLQQTPKALTEKQERERVQWERAIKLDTSNDPLNLWLKYIKWTKLNFTSPTNQKAQLLPLIERCTTKLKDDKRYTNNKHYIKLWLEYAHLSRDSMEVFKYLHANNIGASLALFWRGWAIVAEQQQQYDLVDRIFNTAKQMNARPTKDIQRSYDQFLARMKKKISSQDEEEHIHNQNGQNSRSTLAQITESSNSHRNNHMKPRGFGKEIDTKHAHGHAQNKGKFGIYCDDKSNPNIVELPPVSQGWRELGTAHNRSKENVGMPTPWDNQQLNMKKETNGTNEAKETENKSTFAIPMDDDSICTHWRPAMGEWKQKGRYLCASFCDPNLLRYDGAECSLEEARCRTMKCIWNKEMQQNIEEDEDDMMMTMNVGRILYHRNPTDLSIPSTIKEEPQSLRSDIRTDITSKQNRDIDRNRNRNGNRKRKSSDSDISENEGMKPHKKRFKFNHTNEYDVFEELTTTNLTIGSHYETPLRKLDFATPSHTLLNSKKKEKEEKEEKEDIGSMTEFFKNPIKITDKRMGDTPTVTHIKPRMFNPTQTVTFHSKAAMSDIVKIFGGNDKVSDDNFGIYEDTATIHTKIEMENIEIEDDIPMMHTLSINRSIDPLDENVMMRHELMLLDKYRNSNDIMNETGNDAPITVESLLNGETDIELDDEDAYLNVTQYIRTMSGDNHYIFVVNDLSEEEDTERMLLLDSPSSLRSYHISHVLKTKVCSHMEYALVQSVYLYNNASFTLSKTTDNFQTLNDIMSKTKTLNEKLLLYFVTEIMRIIAQLHINNIIHSNLKLDSFLIKLSECNSISRDWSDTVPPVDGWQNFGLLLHDINHCIKLEDFINIETIHECGAGFLINDRNKKATSISSIFQSLINDKPWCYEVDVFSIFVMMLQLLTQRNDNDILSNINYDQDIVKQIDLLRDEKGLSNLENKSMWNAILNMLLMDKWDKTDKHYLMQCYKHCAVQLMDLEKLSPKLPIILARLDQMIQT